MDCQRKVKGLDGVERTYTYSPLERRAAARIEYESAGLLATLVSKLTSNPHSLSRLLSSVDGGELALGDIAALATVARTIYEVLPFDKLWDVASTVLKDAVITDANGVVARVDSLDECDYFTGRFDEAVVATVKGVGVSFPLLVKRLTGALSKGSAAAAEAKTTSKESNG